MKTASKVLAFASVLTLAALAFADVTVVFLSSKARVDYMCFYPSYSAGLVTTIRGEVCGSTETNTGATGQLQACDSVLLSSGATYTTIRNLVQSADGQTPGPALTIYKTKAGL